METSETAETLGHILLLEDDVRTIQTIEGILSRNSYLVKTVGNSVEALSQMRSRHPDLLVASTALLGFQSPDGWAFVNELRREETFADLPVIVLRPREPGDEGLSGYRRADVKERGLQLRKPLNPQELLAVVRYILS